MSCKDTKLEYKGAPGTSEIKRAKEYYYKKTNRLHACVQETKIKGIKENKFSTIWGGQNMEWKFVLVVNTLGDLL